MGCETADRDRQAARALHVKRDARDKCIAAEVRNGNGAITATSSLKERVCGNYLIRASRRNYRICSCLNRVAISIITNKQHQSN